MTDVDLYYETANALDSCTSNADFDDMYLLLLDLSYPYVLREILEKEKNDISSRYAAECRYCPEETLRMILERGNNNAVSQCAAQNPNCPPDALRMILERGKSNYISWNAFRNPNCPPDARTKWVLSANRTKWLRAHGWLEVEDPNNPNHFIEYEKEKVDTDLQKLRELASNT